LAPALLGGRWSLWLRLGIIGAGSRIGRITDDVQKLVGRSYFLGERRGNLDVQLSSRLTVMRAAGAKIITRPAACGQRPYMATGYCQRLRDSFTADALRCNRGV